MEIDNPTPFDVVMLPMMGPGDTTSLTVIAKATYGFSSGATELATNQIPISFADQFYDEEEGGGIRYESDMVPFKPNTDVVLSSSAYAPEGEPVSELDVALKVGAIEKRLKVFGKRLWNFKGILSKRYVSTEAKPFVKCPIRYSNAFGGMDQSSGEYCDQNLIGKGFYSTKGKEKLNGRPLPRIEDPAHLINSPLDHPTPVGFGFYHRAWQPRASYAGTFDDAWRVDRSPMLPKNFDARYYNGAHPDLQSKGYLHGDESVKLTHLTPEGLLEFDLPGVVPTCSVTRKGRKEVEAITLNLDTVYIEPDDRSLCLVWRGRSSIEDHPDNQIEKATVTVEHMRAGR